MKIITTDQTAAREEVHRCKRELISRFERDLFSLASNLDANEREAWKDFHNRYHQAEPTSDIGGPRDPLSSSAGERGTLTQQETQQQQQQVGGITKRKVSKPTQQLKQRHAPGPKSSVVFSIPTPPLSSPILAQTQSQSSLSPLRPSTAPSQGRLTVHEERRNTVMTLTAQIGENSLRNALASRIEMYKEDMTYRQLKSFLIKTQSEFELLLLEQSCLSKMEAYMKREWALMQGRLNGEATRKLTDLNIKQAKEKTALLHSVESVTSTIDQQEEALRTLQSQHEIETQNLDTELLARRRKKEMRFNASKANTISKMMSKMQSIRNDTSRGCLSPNGVAIFNYVCQIYRLVRKKSVQGGT
jgi:hypothetical protein